MSAFGSAITSSAFGSAIRSSAFGGGLSRAFLTLGGVNEYGPSVWAPTGDHSIEFEISAAAQADKKLVSMSAVSGQAFFIATEPGATFTKIRLVFTGPSGGKTLTTTIDTQDGKLNRFRYAFTIATNTVDTFVNDVASGSTTLTANQAPDFSLMNVLNVGKEAGFGSYFNGILANISLTDTAGGDNRFYPCDDFTFGGGAVMADTLGGQDGTWLNLIESDWDTYTLNTATDPDQWENAGATKIIVVAP